MVRRAVPRRRGWCQWLRAVASALLLSPLLYVVAVAATHPSALARAWTELNVGLLMTNTALLIVATLVTATALGIPLGILLSEVRVYGRNVLAWLLLVALLIPLELHAMAWFAWFGTGSVAAGGGVAGALERWLALFLDPRGSIAPLVARVLAAGWVHGLIGAVMTALIMQPALRQVDLALRAAALLDTKPFGVLVAVLLPQARWAIVAGLLGTLLLTATEIVVVDLVQLLTVADAVYVAFQLEGRWHTALAASVLLLLLLGPLLVVLLRILTPIGDTVHRAPPPRPLWHGRSHAVWGTTIVWAMVTPIALAPLCALLLRTASPITTPWHSLLQALWSTRAVVGRELLVTALVSVMAGTVAVALATLWAYPPAAGSWRRCVVVAAVIGAVAPPLLGLSVALLAMRLGMAFYDSYLPLVWGLSIRCFPLALVIVAAASGTQLREYLDAAAVDGAGVWGAWRRIWLPLMGPVCVAAFALAAVVAASDVGTAVIASPPGTPPLTVRLFGLLHYGFDDYVAGMALWLVALLVPVSLIGIGLTRYAWRNIEELSDAR